ncbi:hypothetical protein FKP32DRAFT_1329284 [Trametes sanguinea]|nr:hypothetical protein FKP32DRAFT_1329284 [Trametes sanguinea]
MWREVQVSCRLAHSGGHRLSVQRRHWRKASLAVELATEAFKASCCADHPAAKLMHLSRDFVWRAGPECGYRCRTDSRRCQSTCRSRHTISG